MVLTLTELLGVGGFIMGVINIFLLWQRYRKDKPIIKIELKDYKKYLLGGNLDPKEYAKKAAQGELNDAQHYRTREIVLDITNSGYRDANLKEIFIVYEQKGRDKLSPTAITFYPTTIGAGDRKTISLSLKVSTEKIENIEKKSPYVIFIEFDFAHKKIKKKFAITEK